jgi:hypothetical protein
MLVRLSGIAGVKSANPRAGSNIISLQFTPRFLLVAMISSSPSLAPGIQFPWWSVPGYVLLGDFPGECEVREYSARDESSGRGLCAPGGWEYRLEIRRACSAEEFRSRVCILGAVYHNMAYGLGTPPACASQEYPGYVHWVEPAVEADDLCSEEK